MTERNCAENTLLDSKNHTGFEGTSRAIGLVAHFSVLLTAAASGLATGAAEGTPLPNKLSGTVHISDSGSVRVSAGLQPLGEHVALPGIRVDGLSEQTEQQRPLGGYVRKNTVKTVETAMPFRVQLMRWAELFKDDPDASETTDGAAQVGRVADGIVQLLEGGATITEVTLHGVASDEDDRTWNGGPDGAGLDADDSKNKQLARHRAEVVTEMLQEALAGRLGKAKAGELKLEVTEGEERRNKELNETIRQIAKDNGETVQGLIVRWNRGDTNGLTAQQLAVLDALKEHRCVEIQVKAIQTKEVPVMVWQDGEFRETTQQKNEHTLVIVPIIIPPLPMRLGGDRRQNRLLTALMGAPSVGESAGRQGGARPPRTIGHELPKHGSVAHVHKQPGRWNNGGNRGTRGQRNIHPARAGGRSKNRQRTR
ncbi:MAG: hypothetical protein Q4B05_03485 [Candidatus Saccharibacteria bacterium]|nr:hypothetical protein [Candidatus Saccharibacteria bacterium]